jgi:antitoxin (DNA-binding transcriptional repressor) of toxin-antitoxin stability system
MTKILSVNEVSMQTVIALTRNGDEIVLEENGKPIAKIMPIEESEQPELKPRVLGLGKGKGYFMSEDFDDELPDEFWGFDKEL